MKSGRNYWTRFASEQLAEAAQYLQIQRDGAGLTFIDDVESSLEQASIHPCAYPAIPDEDPTTRRIILPQFGYWIVYEVRADRIVVLTVWNAVRKPGTWRQEDRE